MYTLYSVHTVCTFQVSNNTSCYFSLEGAGNVLLLEEDVKFYENMREFANYSYSLKDFIRKYELLQYKIEVLEATIELKKAGLAALGNPEVGLKMAEYSSEYHILTY